MRIGFAGLVIVDHVWPLGRQGRHDVFTGVWRNQVSLGTLCVGGFFVLSGFLVTASAQRVSVPRYLWHRALRIMPAFWVCLVVVAFGFGLLDWCRGGHSASTYVAARDGPFRYLASDAKLTMNQYGIAGTPSKVPYPNVWDGSLYTLRYEFWAYLMVAFLAVTRMLRRAVVACATALIWILLQEQSRASLHGHGLITATLLNPVFLRFLLFFAAGAVLYVNTDKIPMDGRYAAVAASVAAVTLFGGGFFILGFVGFAYLVIWAAARLPFRRVGVRSDFSYGVYIYAFPVQQTLATFGVQKHGTFTFIILSLVGTAPFAVASWYLVERPALGLKAWAPRWSGGGLHRRHLPAVF